MSIRNGSVTALLVLLAMVAGCEGSRGAAGGGAQREPSDLVGNAEAGQALYEANDCSACHGQPGMNDPTVAGAADLAGEAAEDVADVLTDEEHSGGTLPGLTADDYADLAAFLGQPGGESDGEGSGEGEEEGEGEGEGDTECEDDADELTGGEPLLRDFTLPIPLFAPGSAWNQRADEVAVLPESDDQMLLFYRALLGDDTSVEPPIDLLWPFMDVGFDPFAVPIFLAGTSEMDVRIRDYDGVEWVPNPKHEIDTLGGPVTVPAPVDTIRPAGPTGTDADGHLVLIDLENFIEYDFWTATTVLDADGNSLGAGQPGAVVLEAGAVDFHDLAGRGANPDGLWSARAVGTPLLAGMILPEDVENGAIDHALGFAMPRPRNTSAEPTEPLAADYFYPASTAESEFYNTNPLALASGQRLRLKQTLVGEEGEPIDESKLAPITRMFLTALRNYGAYVVDNGDGFTFVAEDIHTANLRLSDAKVNELIAQSTDSPLPQGKTKWQMVIERLNCDLGRIPFASGPWDEYGPRGRDPATATYGVANFEVVENAIVPTE